MKEKKGTKLVWLFMPLVLIVGLAIGLSIYWWQKSSSEKEQAKQQTELKKSKRSLS